MLLSRGILLPPRWWWKPVRHRQSFYGGPGPQGRVYYICYGRRKKCKKMISLPIYPKDHYLAKYAIPVKRSLLNSHNLIAKGGVHLKGVKPPAVRDMNFSDGSPVSRSGIVTMHCYKTFAPNLSYGCCHFDSGEQCKYCTVDLARRKWGLSEQKVMKHLLEAIDLTVKKCKVRSITLTSGTFADPDEVAQEWIRLIKRIRQVTNKSLHVQIEPLTDMSIYKKLSNLVQSIGIFLEVFDEDIRKKICPGKSKISREIYFKAWQEAVKYFGRGKVGTSCILGFGEDYNKILPVIDECAKIGVRVILLLARPGSEALGKRFRPSYLGKEKELIKFHIKVAEILMKYGLESKVGAESGCFGCQGCSAMVEACRFVKAVSL